MNQIDHGEAPGRLIEHIPSLDELAAQNRGEQPTYGEQLGLVDGQFVVKRSSGEEETGWSVAYPAEVEDSTDRWVKVVRPNPDAEHPHRAISKIVKVDDLLSWQHTEPNNDATELEKVGALDPLEREKQLMVRIDELQAPFTEKERQDMWAFTAGRLNKRDAQERDDGAGSIAHEQMSGQAYKRLSPQAQRAADQYLVLFQDLQAVRRLK